MWQDGGAVGPGGQDRKASYKCRESRCISDINRTQDRHKATAEELGPEWVPPFLVDSTEDAAERHRIVSCQRPHHSACCDVCTRKI